jgi:hypothetical protein
MTQFSKIRRLIAVSVVVSPLLMFLAFVLLARGNESIALGVFIAGMCSSLAFPPFIEEPDTEKASGLHTEPFWRLLLRGSAVALIMFWVFRLPEWDSLVKRIHKSQVLWDGSLITGFGLLTLCAILKGLSRKHLISDRAIDHYYRMTRVPGRPVSAPK